jgi:hypothetical protein
VITEGYIPHFNVGVPNKKVFISKETADENTEIFEKL